MPTAKSKVIKRISMGSLPKPKFGSRAEAAQLAVLAKFGEQVMQLLAQNPQVTEAFRSLFGPETDPDQVLQTAVLRYQLQEGQ